MTDQEEIESPSCSSDSTDVAVRVSVVIPTFSRPAAIRSCLAALLKQTFPGDQFEIVIVDDGSPVPTELGDVGASKGSDPNHPEIRVVRQDNAGPGAARNRGVREARGQLIAFTDDDCLPLPDWLRVLVAAVDEAPQTLVGGATFNGLANQIFSETSQLIVNMSYDHYNANKQAARFFASNNWLCSKQQYLEIGGFDVNFRAASEDRDFCDRWLAAGWQMQWATEANIEHRHSQHLSNFVKLHFRYGKGAYQFHTERRLRKTGHFSESLAFHFRLHRLISRAFRQYPRWTMRVRLMCAIFIMQLANTAGFVVAAFRSIGNRR